jgi:hypothetical protein
VRGNIQDKPNAASRRPKHGIAGGVMLVGLLLATGAAFVGRGLARDSSSALDFIHNEAAQQEPFQAPIQAPIQARREPLRGDLVVHPRSPRRTVRAASSGVSGRAVCVRLCDGFFFPMGDVRASSEAAESACAGLCPGAPTHVYLVPPGGDGIEGAVSRDGRPYSALPVALRYTKAVDNTCSCKRSLEPQAVLASLARDVTLRAGDVVMTSKGLLVFRGSPQLPHNQASFVALADARNRFANADALSQLESVARLPSQDASEMSALAPARQPASQ